MPPTSSASVQFLNTVLSQRGPSALPYEESLKLTIRSHLLSLLEEFPSLQVKTETFTHNNGEASNLLQVDGTIPMYYLEVMYNIPVTYWLLETYPKSPPRVFVTPTRGMIIKRLHRHVDASGLVSVPYLHTWVFPRSNLVELARSLSLIFGDDPPLYSRPPTSFQSMNSPHAHGAGVKMAPPSPSLGPGPLSGISQKHPCINPVHGAGASSSSSLGSGLLSSMPGNPSPSCAMSQHPGPSSTMSQYPSPPSTLSQHHPYPPYGHPPSSNQSSGRTDSPSVVFRRNAINALVERLQRDVADTRKAKEMDMDKLMNNQGLLRQRDENFRKGLQELQQEKEALEQQLQTSLANTDILDTWLKANAKSNMDVDIDDAFEPCDAVSKQLLECTSLNLAIEDVIYSLDKAAQEGVVPVDAYLKHVRTLSREQFFHRATAVKVRAAQAQSQVAVMAGRASPYTS